ncbi:MAG: hypothetical protein IPK94_08110 [Saprospiraceae bacterium]|nr:hypothetical protein [Saprospiraceae bacterium]
MELGLGPKPVNNKYLGKAAALLAIIAGTQDVIENLGMLKSLNGNISDATAGMTSLCATIKFSFVRNICADIDGTEI